MSGSQDVDRYRFERALLLGLGSETHELFCGLLGRLGTEISTPRDPAAALMKLRAEEVDLVVLGIAKAEMRTAATLIRHIRRDHRFRSRRAWLLVLVTDLAPEDRPLLIEAGASDVLPPIPEIDAVRAALATIVQDRRRFVEAPAFVGPDRRARRPSEWGAPLRRAVDILKYQR